jgi:ribosome-associated protein
VIYSPRNDCRIPEHRVVAANSDEHDPADLPVSKSQLKRDALAMKALAQDLLQLSDAQLRRVPLEPDVLLAIRDTRKMRSHGAQRRQVQYLAKLVRRSDPTDIIAAVAGFQSEARGLTARQHRAEAWRDYLLHGGDPALGELLRQRAGIDVQHLRQLIRNARQEQLASRAPVAARNLFRALRDLDAEQALPPCP